MSRTKQRAVTGALGAAAVVALGLASAYQGERLPDDPSIVGSLTTDVSASSQGDSEQDGAADASAGTGAVATDPIEAFLPRSGQASACREPVGVDLRPGFAATLTINGIAIAPEEMNVVLDASGQPTNEQAASRTLGQYTYGPEDECPNGRVLRATDNVLEVCVYRVEDGPDSCMVSTNTFDVL